MLKVKDLSKDFTIHIREGLKIEGFKKLNLEVEDNSLLAVTGESGVGKSTLLKCIYRTYLPTSGSVLYRQKDNTYLDLIKADDQEIIALRKGEIAYVSQFLHVIPRITAADLLKESLINLSKDENEALEKAKSLLQKVRISERLWNMYPSTFSGGEKQRLNILLALTKEPRFLLLDEPTASLDQVSKDIIYEIILKAKVEGTTMMGVFHDKEAIKVLADKRFHLTKDGGGYRGID